MLKLFVILSLVTFVFSDDLSCYDCDPTDPGKCRDPDQNNVKNTICKDLKDSTSTSTRAFSSAYWKTTLQPGTKDNLVKKVYDCVSLKYEKNAGSDSEFSEGIYRGCVVRNEGEAADPCKVATDNIVGQGNGNVTVCTYCSESNCNRNIPDDGKGGTAGSMASSGIAILISAIFCFYVAKF